MRMDRKLKFVLMRSAFYRGVEKRLVFGQAVFSPLFPLPTPSFCHGAQTYPTLFQYGVW